MKITLLVFLAIVAVLTVVVLLFNSFAPQLGSKVAKEIPENLKKSPNFRNGVFVNPVETNVSFSAGQILPMLKEMMQGNINRKPEMPIKNVPLSTTNFARLPANQTAITWLGHSSFIVQVRGKVMMVDPVFSKRASLLSFMGPKKFAYDFEYQLSDVPELDAILITHDHYDHLDYKAMLNLHGRTSQFYVPLGVKAHLTSWGVDTEKITELDWWDEVHVSDSLMLASVPTRHFTGRRLNNRFSTLWCGWVVKAGSTSILFGGDSGMHNQYAAIGEKYGPFDLTLLECGAYSIYWPDIHSFPAETATAHQTLSGKALMPVHWGKFDLALHGWKEPIEELVKIAEERDIQLVTPRIGEQIKLQNLDYTEKWWRSN